MFSPDSRHVAYVASHRMNTRQMACLVVDGKEGLNYEAPAHMRLGQADENTPLLTAMIRVIIEAGCPTLSLSLTGLRCSPR